MNVNTAVVALTALAQERRLKIFRLLVKGGANGIAAGEIASAVEVPAATLTFHLKELTHSKLISSKREGRSIRYALEVAAVRELLEYLLHDCCDGNPKLCELTIGTCCQKKPRQKRTIRK